MLATHDKYTDVWDCVCKTYDEGGVLNCTYNILSCNFFPVYNGYDVSVLGIIFYRSLFFGAYDAFRPDNLKSTPIAKFCLSQCIVILAGMGSYPYDTARRRAMVTGASASDCWDQIVQDQGMSGLFAGAFWNVCRGLLSSSVLLAIDYAFPAFSGVNQE